MAAISDFIIKGKNKAALFTLKVYRGEGMLLLAMNWKKGTPPKDFVGFSIEYKEPGGDRFYALKNRIDFLNENGKPGATSVSSLQAPFQKFRWIHFPRNANMKGKFRYLVKPVFMNSYNELSYGEHQVVDIELHHETYPDKLDVSFTRGYVSSQAFVDKYGDEGGIATLLPSNAKLGIDYTPTHPKADEALAWMGFEAVSNILQLLDDAIEDIEAEVKVVAYDLNEPEVLNRLIKLGQRLKIIIDDSGEHKHDDSSENISAKRLEVSSGGNVKRHHMSQLQHNKIIIVNGPKIKAAVCGSTNFTWRGFYVQANNTLIVKGEKAIKPFVEAFDNYWKYDKAKDYSKTISAEWNDLQISEIDAKVSFSPHSAQNNALLDSIANDIANNTKSNLFYSLAFLFQTEGAIRESVEKLTQHSNIFVYGISDRKIGGLDVQKPNGNISPVYPSQLTINLPEPFKSEPTGGRGIRMHHKFLVVDFDKPTARVYTGSYNFSQTADLKNGENLLIIKDQKVAVAYMLEALRMIDHYHFRVAINESKEKARPLTLSRPPRKKGEKAWWESYYSDPRKIKDREMFG